MISTDDGLDKALAIRAKDGDQDAFSTLFLRYREEVYICLMRVVHNDEYAKDLWQDTYIKALYHVQKLNNPSQFRPWLLTIAKHLAFDWLRQNHRGRTISLEENASVFDPIDENANSQVVVEREYVQSVLARIEPPVLRNVLVLHTIGGYSRVEIAHRLGYAEGTVVSYLSRARKQFWRLYHLMDSTEGQGSERPLGTIKSPRSHSERLPAAYQQQGSDSLSNDLLEQNGSLAHQGNVHLDQSDHSQGTHHQQQFSAPVDPDQFPPKLRARYREILLLQEVQHLSCEAIAQRLQIDEENVRVLLHRARQRRKALLQQEGQKHPPRRSRPINEENLQKLLCNDSFFQCHFYSPYAQVLRLAYGEGLMDQEIATRLSIPLGTVKCRLAQAVSHLNSFHRP